MNTTDVRYFVRVVDDPKSDDYMQPQSLHRWYTNDGGVILLERWDRDKGKWADNPALIAACGIGGDEDYIETTEWQALELLREWGGGKAKRSKGPGYHAPHYGRPGQVGGSKPRTDKPASGEALVGTKIREMREVERLIVGLDHEEAYFVDYDAKIILFKRGTKNSVKLTLEDVKLIKDTIMTHNHPESKGLSIDDVTFAVGNNLRAVQAVTRSGDKVFVHKLWRPHNALTWGISVEEVEKVANREMAKQWWEWSARVAYGDMTAKQADKECFHDLWLRVSKHFGWSYHRDEYKWAEFSRAAYVEGA